MVNRTAAVNPLADRRAGAPGPASRTNHPGSPTVDRIAVISDIHSNHRALEAVAAEARRRGCEGFHCLGDVVGYGVRPRECLDWVKEHCPLAVQGNHDAMVGGVGLGLAFNVYSLAAVEHNRRILTAADRRWLADLPPEREAGPGVLLVHGAPGDRDRYLLYLGELQETALGLLAERGPGVCFFGHTHLPAAFAPGGFLDLGAGPLALPGLTRILINPGSVGQPRDGDPRASFVVWDRTAGTVELVRVAYDVQAAREDVLAAGLPRILGDRLLAGR